MNKETVARYIKITEVLGVPIFLGWYIWCGSHLAPYSIIAVFIWGLISFVTQGDTLETLGFETARLKLATLPALVACSAFSLLLILFALVTGTLRADPTVFRTFDFGLYLTLCLVEQIFLNSFLNNRLLSITNRKELASLIAGTIFAALHWPNLFIVAFTFVGGSLMAFLFSRNRSILPLAIGHTWIIFLIFLTLPVSLHRSLFVGPAYYRQARIRRIVYGPPNLWSEPRRVATHGREFAVCHPGTRKI